MKVTILFLLLCILNTFAGEVFSQTERVNIHAKNIQAKDVLEQIENQTDYLFVYNHTIDLSKKVNLEATNMPVADVLSRVFTNSDILYAKEGSNILLIKKSDLLEDSNAKSEKNFTTLKGNSIRLNNSPLQNTRTITGKVVDQLGEPVIGANISVKNTTNGVITDINGHFSLQVEPNAILTISYIGYNSQEIAVSNQTNLSIVLQEDLLRLDEVVVVGYGTAKKSDLAGAVVRADLEKLQESPNTNLMSALQGVVPGLNVGAVAEAGKDPAISIRGRTSISGTNNPLIVLDGIIFRGNMIDINMNDVESVDVLKDASAAAIYGSEASNGVILITSKTGKTMSKPIISYSGSYSYQQPTNKKLLPEGRDGFLRKIADRFLSESRTGDDLMQRNPDWDVTKHLMDRNTLDGYNNGVDTDWWDLLTNNVPYIQNQNVSIRGKNELSAYFFSVGYLDQKNLVINDTYKRYNVRINLDMKVTNWLKVGTSSFFTMSDLSGKKPEIGNVIGLPPIVAVRDSEGELIKQPYKTTLNPLLEIQQNDLNKRNHLSGTFFADLNIPSIKGLNYRINFSQNLIDGKEYNFNKWGENFTGTGSKKNTSQYTWLLDHILSYQNTFDKHAINGTLLYGMEKRQFEETTAEAKVFSNDVLGYNKLDVGKGDLQVAKSGAWEEASLYMMARLGYTYNDRYIFTGTVRRDGFSGFGKNHKFGLFPSAAIAWRISEEDFIKNKLDYVDNLKLRLSYGTNGNRTVGRYQTLARLDSRDGYLYGDGGSPEQMQWVRALPNADLQWETTKTFNFGLDYSVLSSRISGSMEFYTSNTTNLLYNVEIPEINGLDRIPKSANPDIMPMNIGKMGNKGFEFSITGVPVKTKDFSWDITFNYSINRNKVISILGIDADGDGKEDDLISSKIFINKPYGVCYDYNIIGMWQIADKMNGSIPSGFDYGTYKVEDMNGDGKYTADKDRKIVGYTDPSYRFSIQNTLRYKDWEFKFFINSIQGGKDYYYGQPGRTLANPDNMYQTNLFNFDYWTPENPNARYRQLGYYTQALGSNFSPYVQRSFIRLQDVTLSYNLPKSLIKKLNINHLKVYITGKNLLTITDWDGWDPEIVDNDGVAIGLDASKYPLMRSYSVGLNFEF